MNETSFQILKELRGKLRKAERIHRFQISGGEAYEDELREEIRDAIHLCGRAIRADRRFPILTKGLTDED